MLILHDDLRAQLLAVARAAFPAEACGLLIGSRDGANVTVTALHPAANVSPTPRESFAIDPAVQFSLQRTLRGTGQAENPARGGGPAIVGRPRGAVARSATGVSEIIGCYHSHPNGRAEPSPRDRANGCADGFIWIIIATGVITGVVDAIAAFEGPSFQPLAIRV